MTKYNLKLSRLLKMRGKDNLGTLMVFWQEMEHICNSFRKSYKIRKKNMES
jgi:hypothetical protein